MVLKMVALQGIVGWAGLVTSLAAAGFLVFVVGREVSDQSVAGMAVGCSPDTIYIVCCQRLVATLGVANYEPSTECTFAYRHLGLATP